MQCEPESATHLQVFHIVVKLVRSQPLVLRGRFFSFDPMSPVSSASRCGGDEDTVVLIRQDHQCSPVDSREGIVTVEEGKVSMRYYDRDCPLIALPTHPSSGVIR
jgi:hypothetical protein